jgi:large subunit ribosomal protein L30
MMSEKTTIVIRIRGGIDCPHFVKDTMKMLRVDRTNCATILRETPSYLGMLRKAKDYITWGEVSVETIKLVLEKRGRLIGDKQITDEAIKELGYEGIEALAEKIKSGELDFSNLAGIKPFFRMHPPKKGFKRTVKRPFRDKGELGNRGEAIDELVKRMC